MSRVHELSDLVNRETETRRPDEIEKKMSDLNAEKLEKMWSDEKDDLETMGNRLSNKLEKVWDNIEQNEQEIKKDMEEQKSLSCEMNKLEEEMIELKEGTKNLEEETKKMEEKMKGLVEEQAVTSTLVYEFAPLHIRTLLDYGRLEIAKMFNPQYETWWDFLQGEHLLDDQNNVKWDVARHVVSDKLDALKKQDIIQDRLSKHTIKVICYNWGCRYEEGNPRDQKCTEDEIREAIESDDPELERESYIRELFKLVFKKDL